MPACGFDAAMKFGEIVDIRTIDKLEVEAVLGREPANKRCGQLIEISEWIRHTDHFGLRSPPFFQNDDELTDFRRLLSGRENLVPKPFWICGIRLPIRSPEFVRKSPCKVERQECFLRFRRS